MRNVFQNPLRASIIHIYLVDYYTSGQDRSVGQSQEHDFERKSLKSNWTAVVNGLIRPLIRILKISMMMQVVTERTL